MMKTFTFAAVAIFALLVTGSFQAMGAEGKGEKKEGNIRVLKVIGSVTVTHITEKKTEPLKEGVFIQQDEVVTTGKDSSALLLLSNGTTVTVEPNSTFHVDKFLQTPFDSKDVNYRELKAEPSVSQTTLSVTAGSIVADVCKLNKGSTFNISTPVGVAGIRGTIIRVTVQQTGGGRTSVTVDLPEGTVDFATVDGRSFTLTNGTTVTIELANGTTVPSAITQMTPEEKQEVQAIVQEAMNQVPTEQSFEGVQEGAPEIQDGTLVEDDAVGGFGGDQGNNAVGTAPGGSGGGGGGGGGGTGTASSSPTAPPPPTPNPPPS